MENYFGKGLMVGLQVFYVDIVVYVVNFCVDYKCGFVFGYLYCMFEKIGDCQFSVWEVGIFICCYGFDRDMVMDFFKEGGLGMVMCYFLVGYWLES